MTKINENQKKDLILILFAVLLLVFIGFVVFNFSPRASRFLGLSPQVIGKSTLTIDFGNDKKRAFSGDIVLNETLVGVLMQASKAGDFSYKLDEKSNLTAVEKFVADGKKSWHWYLNGEKINKSLNEIVIKDGDNILLRYESR